MSDEPIDVVAADKHKRTQKLAEALQALWDLKYGGEHELNEVWGQAQRAVESFQDDYVLQLVEEEIEQRENQLFEEVTAEEETDAVLGDLSAAGVDPDDLDAETIDPDDTEERTLDDVA